MVGELHGLRPRVPLVRPPVEAGAAERDGPVKEAPGERREHVVVDGGAAGAHAEQGDGRGVPAVVGDVLLDPSVVRALQSRNFLATLIKITSSPPLDPTCRSFPAPLRPQMRGIRIC